MNRSSHFIRDFSIFVLTWGVVIFLIPKYESWNFYPPLGFIFDNFDVATVGSWTIIIAIGINYYLFRDIHTYVKTPTSTLVKWGRLAFQTLIIIAVVISLLFSYIIHMYYHGIGF